MLTLHLPAVVNGCCRLKTVTVLALAGNQVPQTSNILGGKDAQETQTPFSNDVLFPRRIAAAHPQRLWRGFILVFFNFLSWYTSKGRYMD